MPTDSASGPVRRPSGTLLGNVLWNFGGQAWSVLVALVTTPYIIRHLGTDAYGLLSAASIVTTYLWFMDLGLGQATTKYVAEHAALNDWPAVRATFWTALGAYVVLGATATLVVVAAAVPCVDYWLHVPAHERATAIRVVQITGLGMLPAMARQAPAAILPALDRFDLSNKITAGIATAQSGATVLLLARGYSVLAVVMVNSTAILVTCAVTLALAARLIPDLGPFQWKSAVFRRLFRFGGPSTIEDLANPVLANVEKFVLAGVGSAGTLTFYIVPFSVISRLLIVPTAVGTALFPVYSSLHAVQNQQRSAEMVIRAQRHVCVLLLPIVCLAFLFAHELLAVWMGPAFADRSAGALRFLSLALASWATATSPFYLLRAYGRSDITMWIRLAELPVAIAVTVACIHAGGVTGAAIAFFIYRTLDAILLWAAAGAIVGYRVRDLFASLPSAAVVGTVVACGVGGKLALRAFGAPSLALLGAVFAATIAFATLVAWSRDLSVPERSAILARLRTA